MIKAYVVGISNHYEGEDIELRYSLFEDQEHICNKSVYKEYRKPLVVNHVALLALLRDLVKYKGKEIIILINDASLAEQIEGTSQTKKSEVLKMARRVRQELNKFGDSVTVLDVSKDTVKVKEWNDMLRF